VKLAMSEACTSQFEFMTDLGVEALHFVALPGNLRPFLGHLDFHFPHLLHHGVCEYLNRSIGIIGSAA